MNPTANDSFWVKWRTLVGLTSYPPNLSKNTICPGQILRLGQILQVAAGGHITPLAAAARPFVLLKYMVGLNGHGP